MNRLHPHDLRAIVAASMFGLPQVDAEEALAMADRLLAENERTAEPVPMPGFHHGRGTVDLILNQEEVMRRLAAANPRKPAAATTSPGLEPPRPAGCPSCAQAEAEVDRLKGEVDRLKADLDLILTSRAARNLLNERSRQVDMEGWTPEHDDEHTRGELAFAAACYAAQAGIDCGEGRTIEPGHDRAIVKAVDFVRSGWPWAPVWWKPSRDRRRNLVKAGALILAEIERLDRAAAKKEA